MPGRTTGAHVAGDVATTGTAAADVTQSVPERGESPVPGQDAVVASEAAPPRRARSRSARAAGPAADAGAAPVASQPPGDSADAPSPAPPSTAAPGITGGAGVR